MLVVPSKTGLTLCLQPEGIKSEIYAYNLIILTQMQNHSTGGWNTHGLHLKCQLCQMAAVPFRDTDFPPEGYSLIKNRLQMYHEDE